MSELILDATSALQLRQALMTLQKRLVSARIDPAIEARAQADVERILTKADVQFEREAVLDQDNRIDFLCVPGIGIELKVNTASPMDVYRQCARYCELERIKALILVTSRRINLPAKINGKPVRCVWTAAAWI